MPGITFDLVVSGMVTSDPQQMETACQELCACPPSGTKGQAHNILAGLRTHVRSNP